ncbi:XRE family transcriptional regulator [Achromobacter seleniivolatilans]|uniref:XRE family transcriptional regulator n=1 Tax=Achromobacter seleniivolatilans TaxID=3047478 RepID=A0ABY9M5M5_9BURK|nr:XRE family transcriptional regulator [Achromobacter sp. R39]WMD21493.1 XRE family transcriptional regulator [Achromobacter sp. R39]
MPLKTPASPADDILADRSSLGVRLRALRKARPMTLKELSALTGVALSTLSKMELGQVSISYAKFAAVARALDVDIAELFGPAAAPDNTGPAPTALRCTLDESPGYLTGTYDYKLLAGQYPHRSMTPMYGRILARDASEFDDYMRHAGQEFLVVLEGELEIRFENGDAMQLAKHETAYFDSGVGHIYLSRSAKPAEIMVVMTAWHDE